MEKEKPPIFGMLQRTSEVVILMLEDVKQATIVPLIRATIAFGSTAYTDEYGINARLEEWGYAHETVCHAAREYARDDDGDRFWSLLRSWLRPHRGIPQESLPLYPGIFESVHDVRACGRRMLGSLIGLLLAPPCDPSRATDVWSCETGASKRGTERSVHNQSGYQPTVEPIGSHAVIFQ